MAVTKGIVEDIVDSAHVKVRIPIYDGYAGLTNSTLTEDLSVASICTASGIYPNLRVGDEVYVTTENRRWSEPVIMGKVVSEGMEATDYMQSDGKLLHLTVGSSAQLPYDTMIGDVTATNIQYLKGLSDNVQAQLNMIKAALQELENSQGSTMPNPEVTDYKGIYDGEPHSVQVKADGSELEYSTDDITYTSYLPYYKDVGNYKLYIKASNAIGVVKVEGHVKISQRDIPVYWNTSPIIYTGKDNTPTHYLTNTVEKDNIEINEFEIINNNTGNIVNEAIEAGVYTATVKSIKGEGAVKLNYTLSNTSYTFIIQNPVEDWGTYESTYANYDGEPHSIIVTKSTSADVQAQFSTDGITFGDWVDIESQEAEDVDTTQYFPTSIEAGATQIYFKVRFNNQLYPLNADYYRAIIYINPKELSVSWDMTTLNLTYTGTNLVPNALLNGILNSDVCTLKISAVDINNQEIPSVVPGEYTARIISISGEDSKNYCLPDTDAKREIDYSIISSTVLMAPSISYVTLNDGTPINSSSDYIDVTTSDTFNRAINADLCIYNNDNSQTPIATIPYNMEFDVPYMRKTTSIHNTFEIAGANTLTKIYGFSPDTMTGYIASVMDNIHEPYFWCYDPPKWNTTYCGAMTAHTLTELKVYFNNYSAGGYAAKDFVSYLSNGTLGYESGTNTTNGYSGYIQKYFPQTPDNGQGAQESWDNNNSNNAFIKLLKENNYEAHNLIVTFRHSYGKTFANPGYGHVFVIHAIYGDKSDIGNSKVYWSDLSWLEPINDDTTLPETQRKYYSACAPRLATLRDFYNWHCKGTRYSAPQAVFHFASKFIRLNDLPLTSGKSYRIGVKLRDGGNSSAVTMLSTPYTPSRITVNISNKTIWNNVPDGTYVYEYNNNYNFAVRNGWQHTIANKSQYEYTNYWTGYNPSTNNVEDFVVHFRHAEYYEKEPSATNQVEDTNNFLIKTGIAVTGNLKIGDKIVVTKTGSNITCSHLGLI